MPRIEKDKQWIQDIYEQTVKDLHKKGLSYATIGKIMRRDKSVIHRIINSKNKT